MTNRLFITLDIPSETLNEVIANRDLLYNDKHPRWEGRDKLHITLKFLGDTNIDLIPKIEDVLYSVSEEFNPIPLTFNKFGIFYRNHNPKILWLGTKESDELNKLANRIDEVCSELNFEKETRSFHPHLTLLRIKGTENIKQLEKMKQFEIKPIIFTSKTISLMRSELKPNGSVYNTIKSFELSKSEE